MKLTEVTCWRNVKVVLTGHRRDAQIEWHSPTAHHELDKVSVRAVLARFVTHATHATLSDRLVRVHFPSSPDADGENDRIIHDDEQGGPYVDGHALWAVVRSSGRRSIASSSPRATSTTWCVTEEVIWF